MGFKWKMNVASLAVCVCGLALWPSVRHICKEDIASFYSQPESDGARELQQCYKRLSESASAWSEANLSGMVAGAVWWAETGLFLMVHLIDALCTCLLVAFTWTSVVLRLVCVAVATAATLLAESRPIDAALGLSKEATLLGQSVAAILIERAATATALWNALTECVLTHGTSCLLTDQSFNANQQPQEMVWMRDASLQLVKIWNVMQVRCAKSHLVCREEGRRF